MPGPRTHFAWGCSSGKVIAIARLTVGVWHRPGKMHLAHRSISVGRSCRTSKHAGCQDECERHNTSPWPTHVSRLPDLGEGPAHTLRVASAPSPVSYTHLT